jgi:hypothetical protein
MRKFMFNPSALVLVIAMLFSNCATIVSKSSYPVLVRTTPAGATVVITDKKGREIYKGTSPAHVTLKAGAGYFSKAEYSVKISMGGYEEKIIPINFNLNGWYFGNLLIGGWIGMLIVDPLSGAMWKIKNPVVNESLSKLGAVTGNVPELKIMDIKDVAPEMKEQLVRIK